MATKQWPGEYDCYAKAEPNEPLFVLLARDELAPHVVRIWAALRSVRSNSSSEADIKEAVEAALIISLQKDTMPISKYAEARAAAGAMELWLKQRNCEHVKHDTGTDREKARGWRPGYCNKCGKDMSVDSGG